MNVSPNIKEAHERMVRLLKKPGTKLAEELGDDEYLISSYCGQLFKECGILLERANIGATPDKPHTVDRLHMAIGLAGEAGELLDAVKRVIIYQKAPDIENLTEEMGDLEFYYEGYIQTDVKNPITRNSLAMIRKSMDRIYIFLSDFGTGINQELALQHNLNKLLTGDRARYKDQVYSDQAAINREDKK